MRLLYYRAAVMNSLRKAARLGCRLLTVAASKPKRLSHILGSALAATEDVIHPDCDLLKIPQVNVADLLPESGDPWCLNLAFFPRTFASVSVLEFSCLVILMRRARAKRVFEFGTYMGVSTTQLALNLPSDGTFYTLDLPEDSNGTRLQITDPDERAISVEKGKGGLIPADLKKRITFVRQDSASFDEAPLADSIDFVFIDGAHSYEYVKNDSEKGWRMLRRGGVIAWHDFRPQDPDVVRYLIHSNFQISWIAGTSIAFAVKP